MNIGNAIHKLFYPDSHRTRRRRERQELLVTLLLAVPLVVLAGLFLYHLQERMAL